MKKILAAFAACIAVLNLSACSSGSSGQPTFFTPVSNNSSTQSSQSGTASVSAPTSSKSSSTSSKSSSTSSKSSSTSSKSSSTSSKSSSTSSKSSSGSSLQPESDGKEFTFNNKKGIYTGDWENGAPNGYGTFTANDGTTISGKWENGKTSGKVTMNFATGETAEVDFDDDRLRIWFLTYTDKDGTKITMDGILGKDGGFVQDGKITYNYKDGTSREENGRWGDNGQFLSGTIKTTYKDGSSEEIEVNWSMEDGDHRYMSTGSRIIKSKDGTTVRYSGNWNANGYMYSGLCRIDKPDGTYSVRDGRWENGEFLNGTYQIYDTNNKLKYKGTVKNGKYSGDWEKLFGAFLKGFGEGLGETGHPFWGAAVEGIGDVVGNHGSLN